jgi:hypothetical protein
MTFSSFALADSFSSVPRASGPVFIFLWVRTNFLRYRGHSVKFSCFASPDSFSAVPMASGPVLMYCESGHVFCGTEGVLSLFHISRARTHFFDSTECVGSRFHVLRAQTRCWLYRGRQVLFSCFALPDSFSAIPRASSLVFMYCGSGLIFCRTEGIRSRFLVLLARIRFR